MTQTINLLIKRIAQLNLIKSRHTSLPKFFITKGVESMKENGSVNYYFNYNMFCIARILMSEAEFKDVCKKMEGFSKDLSPKGFDYHLATFKSPDMFLGKSSIWVFEGLELLDTFIGRMKINKVNKIQY